MTPSDRPSPLRRKGGNRSPRRQDPERAASSTTAPAERPARPGRRSQPSLPRGSYPRSGWLVIARKDFADHIRSARFIVLVVILGLAAVVPLYFVAERIRSLASEVSGSQAIFLALFQLDPGGDNPLPSAARFIAIVAPLLGVAFAFDAVNGERSDGTLARLVAQPIHRDDVINGKFFAGLLAIFAVLVTVVMIISAFGIFRLGITPEPGEVLRVVAWILTTGLYVSLWLAFGMLLSVVFRHAATSALVGFGVWNLVVIFGSLVTSFVANFIAPLADTATVTDTQSLNDYLSSSSIQEFILRLSPQQLYGETITAMLNPDYTGQVHNLAEYAQASSRLPTLLSLDQSLLVVWPQVVILLSMTLACFAGAYVLFMRQEVRA